MTAPNKTTEKQIIKLNRQRCVALLEKMTKMLLGMFHDATTTKEQLIIKFSPSYSKLQKLGDVYLDSEYLREIKSYIDKVPQILANAKTLNDIRDTNKTTINRIQKIKNANEYKKEKHTKRFEL